MTSSVHMAGLPAASVAPQTSAAQQSDAQYGKDTQQLRQYAPQALRVLLHHLQKALRLHRSPVQE